MSASEFDAPGTSKDIRIEVVRGVEGLALYVAGLRVKGPKPWGGGESVASFLVSSAELEEALWPRPRAKPKRGAAFHEQGGMR